MLGDHHQIRHSIVTWWNALKGGTDAFSREAKNSKPGLARSLGEHGAVFLRCVTIMVHNCHRISQMFQAEHLFDFSASNSFQDWKKVMNRGDSFRDSIILEANSTFSVVGNAFGEKLS